MLVGLGILLLITWILAFAVFHVAGALIHLLAIAAVICFVWRFVLRRKKTT